MVERRLLDTFEDTTAMSEEKTVELNEHELSNDYPIYADYLYVADGNVYCSDYHGITARELKRRENFESVTNCDIYGRQRLGMWNKP